MTPSDKSPAVIPPAPAGAETILLGAGCFWCTEGVFQQIPGVRSVLSGYTGGKHPNPTYQQVCSGETGHNEVARLVFDPQQTSLEAILQTFWKMHDPTTLNRQGGDVGTQYRSGIYHFNEQQRETAEASKRAAAAQFSRPIVTEILPAGEFYPAENYHQDYYQQNKTRNPYCSMVITPKLAKLGLKT